MQEEFSRTARLLGEEAITKLSRCRIAVFGLGGVGGYVVEALARSGVGMLDLIDGDTVSVTNINRQILALQSTLGQYKAEVAAQRVKSINPHICANERVFYYGKDNENAINFTDYDYVVDAIDCVTSKLLIVEKCKAANVPLISCMGTGNKLDPTAFKVADIFDTSVCPLAKAMRRELKKRGVEKLKVVYSEEQPLNCEQNSESPQNGGQGGVKDNERRVRSTPASVAFVPASAGLLIASEVLKDLIS